MADRTVTAAPLRWADCPACGGSGEHQPGSDPQVVYVCRRCSGRGEVLASTLDEGSAA